MFRLKRQVLQCNGFGIRITNWLSGTILLLQRTRKKFCVEPESRVPYWISVCLARSSADSIGVNMRSTVKKAACRRECRGWPFVIVVLGSAVLTAIWICQLWRRRCRHVQQKEKLAHSASLVSTKIVRNHGLVGVSPTPKDDAAPHWPGWRCMMRWLWVWKTTTRCPPLCRTLTCKHTSKQHQQQRFNNAIAFRSLIVCALKRRKHKCTATIEKEGFWQCQNLKGQMFWIFCEQLILVHWVSGLAFDVGMCRWWWNRLRKSFGLFKFCSVLKLCKHVWIPVVLFLWHFPRRHSPNVNRKVFSDWQKPQHEAHHNNKRVLRNLFSKWVLFQHFFQTFVLVFFKQKKRNSKPRAKFQFGLLVQQLNSPQVFKRIHVGLFQIGGPSCLSLILNVQCAFSNTKYVRPCSTKSKGRYGRQKDSFLIITVICDILNQVNEAIKVMMIEKYKQISTRENKRNKTWENIFNRGEMSKERGYIFGLSNCFLWHVELRQTEQLALCDLPMSKLSQTWRATHCGCVNFYRQLKACSVFTRHDVIISNILGVQIIGKIDDIICTYACTVFVKK